MRRKPKTECRTNYIMVRVTDEQKKMLSAVAAKYGLDLSSWLRSLGMREAQAQ